MKIETERLVITEFTMDMAQSVHENSLDEDTRRFVPDEVFETLEDAQETIEFLMSQYGGFEGPLVYPVITKDGEKNIGYVQLVPLEDGSWEIGYHVGKKYTGNGYATEAVSAFLPEITGKAGITEVYGTCLKENIASVCVMKKVGFTEVFEGVGEYQGEQREIFKSVWRK
ncbi:MAG: GNAT family N-acetyltransferase [Clostridiales bacterium]|nr:GNAT family N-acetyltransferase [Clostridiales bacterium]